MNASSSTKGTTWWITAIEGAQTMLRFSLASLADRTTQQDVWVHISNALNVRALIVWIHNKPPKTLLIPCRKERQHLCTATCDQKSLCYNTWLRSSEVIIEEVEVNMTSYYCGRCYVVNVHIFCSWNGWCWHRQRQLYAIQAEQNCCLPPLRYVASSDAVAPFIGFKNI
jgi:hypothetical protein